MVVLRRVLVPATVLLLSLAVSAAAQEPDSSPVERPDVQAAIDEAVDSTPAEAQEILDPVAGGDEPGEEEPGRPPEGGDDPSFADRVSSAFAQEAVVFGVAGLVTVAAGLGGFAFVTRYISPKEALKNPQRAMLYGFVRATPGAHLKRLSEEFGMKTSSILWHIRKLESAELVKSERVNGYRVFYPVEGGIEIKRVSRALAALQNDNAMRVFQNIQGRPGSTARGLADRLSLHGGTVRWHLRKLRDHGLLDELIQEDGSKFFPTPLGDRALEAREGRPVDGPRPTRTPVPTPE